MLTWVILLHVRGHKVVDDRWLMMETKLYSVPSSETNLKGKWIFAQCSSVVHACAIYNQYFGFNAAKTT